MAEVLGYSYSTTREQTIENLDDSLIEGKEVDIVVMHLRLTDVSATRLAECGLLDTYNGYKERLQWRSAWHNC